MMIVWICTRHFQPAHALRIEYHAVGDLYALRGANIGNECWRGLCLTCAGNGRRLWRNRNIERYKSILITFPAEESGVPLHAFQSLDLIMTIAHRLYELRLLRGDFAPFHTLNAGRGQTFAAGFDAGFPVRANWSQRTGLADGGERGLGMQGRTYGTNALFAGEARSIGVAGEAGRNILLDGAERGGRENGGCGLDRRRGVVEVGETKLAAHLDRFGSSAGNGLLDKFRLGRCGCR